VGKQKHNEDELFPQNSHDTLPLNKINALARLKHPLCPVYIITMRELEYVEAIFAYREHESIEKLKEDAKA
jgi:hypothetical protein